jgi:hypothetical protein
MNPPHEPTAEARGIVQALAQFGVPQPQIAAKIGVGEKTLRKYYATELNDGATAANLAVAQRLYDVATKGTGKEAVTAAIFWLKTRAGWRETINVNDVTDPNAGARERLAAKLGVAPPSGEADEIGPGAPIGSA